MIANSRLRDLPAVIPAAGSGTRLFPITKTLPKEILPVIDKPLIEYSIREAVDCGISRFVLITGLAGNAIHDYLAERSLYHQYRMTDDQLKPISELNGLLDAITISFVLQEEPLGLGHAVLAARSLVGDSAFAVLLADDLILSKPSCLDCVLNVHEVTKESVIGLYEVPEEATKSYGIVWGERVEDISANLDVYRIRGIVEKPENLTEVNGSRLSVMGRYVFRPEVFTYLAEIEPGKNDEIQLTEGIKELLRSRPVYGVVFPGSRVDAGDAFGYLKASIEVGLRRQDLGQKLRQHLRELFTTESG